MLITETLVKIYDFTTQNMIIIKVYKRFSNNSKDAKKYELQENKDFSIDNTSNKKLNLAYI